MMSHTDFDEEMDWMSDDTLHSAVFTAKAAKAAIQQLEWSLKHYPLSKRKVKRIENRCEDIQQLLTDVNKEIAEIEEKSS